MPSLGRRRRRRCSNSPTLPNSSALTAAACISRSEGGAASPPFAPTMTSLSFSLSRSLPAGLFRRGRALPLPGGLASPRPLAQLRRLIDAAAAGARESHASLQAGRQGETTRLLHHHPGSASPPPPTVPLFYPRHVCSGVSGPIV